MYTLTRGWGFAAEYVAEDAVSATVRPPYPGTPPHTGDKGRLYAVDKNQPLYVRYRTNIM